MIQVQAGGDRGAGGRGGECMCATVWVYEYHVRAGAGAGRVSHRKAAETLRIECTYLKRRTLYSVLAVAKPA